VIAVLLAITGFTSPSLTVAVAAPAPQGTPTVAPAYPVRGEPFSVTGRLTTRVKRPVQVELLVGTEWAPVAFGTTSSSGSYTLRTSSATPVSALRVVAPQVLLGTRTYAQLVTRTRTLRTVSVLPSVPMVGEKFTMSDVLPTTAPPRPVALQRKVGRKWRTVRSGTTDAAGLFTLETTSVATSMYLRVVARKVRMNARTYPQVTTAVAKVLSVRQSGAISGPPSGNLNAPMTITMTFKPAREGRQVTLESLISGRWRVMASGSTDAGGTVAIETIPAAQGRYIYRGVAAAWKGAPSVATYTMATSVGPQVDPTPGLAVTVGTQAGSLEPGGPSVTVPFTATNVSDAPQTLDATVTVAFADPQGVAWVAPAGCPPQAYHAQGSLTGGAATVVPGASVDGVVTITMDNLPINQDACKGAELPLHISVS
jgi:hypothetical protein